VARNPRAARFIRRCYRALIMVASVAVVIGLAASVTPARAATAVPSRTQSHAARVPGTGLDASATTLASGDTVVDLDFGQSLDPTTTQNLINWYKGQNSRLSDTIERVMEEYDVAPALGSALGIAVPETTADWQNFDGTVTLNSDGTGLSLTLPASEGVNASLTFWQAFWANALGFLATVGIQVICDLALPTFHPVCSFAAGFMGAFIADWIKLAIDGQSVTDPANLGPTLADGLWAGIGGVALEGVFNFFETTFVTILKDIGSYIVKKAKTAWAYLRFSSYLTIFGQLLTDSAPHIQIQLRNLGNGASRTTVSSLPCDVYAYNGTPCTATYSMDRALYAYYNGPLYQVQRASDGTRANIGLLSTGGDVNATEQDNFCNDTSCTITEIYDQSPNWNNLTPAPGGQEDPHADSGAHADTLKITIGGHEAYGVDITGSEVGYRDDSTTGVATGDEPEGMYMVASGTNVNNQCCMDFGNAETTDDDDGGGAMDALNVSTRCNTKYGATCSGTGPWVQADLENGLFQNTGTSANPDDTPNASDFVTAVLKNNGTSNFELKGGNAQSGTLSTLYNGPLPTQEGSNKWVPMRKQGAIVLGVGGDNSNAGTGSFFEGVMTAGIPTDAADAAVQANIVAAGYGGDSAGSAVPQNADAAVVNDGITYDFSVDAKNGDLQESSLTAQGADWATQDLTATAGTPPLEQDTTPVAVVHDGVTSVFTISTDHHLWETHMRPGVTSWQADDLTVLAGTPQSKVTPSALFHNGYTTVYTIDASNGHLQSTYLKVLNGSWTTADLTTQTPGAPPAQPGTSPVSILHNGEASVFTVGTGHDIWETYLPTIDGTWSARDITALSSGPQTTSTVTAVFHQDVLTVFAAGDPLRHLLKLRLPSLGGSWSAQDLTAAAPKTPPVAPGTSPAALFHNGYTTVYTVDETSLDLQTTYLPSLSGDWATENLSADYKTPPTTETPVPLLHPGTDGLLDRISVFTVNQFDNDLQDTYLVAEGDPWTTQDMHALADVPPVMVNASPAATWSVANDGYTYVFRENPSSGDLVVSYLPALGAAWQTKDLTAAGQAPELLSGTDPVAVAWDGHVTVFTVGNAKGDLWQTTLSANGGSWSGTDLTAATGGPPTGVTPTAEFHGGYLSAYTVNDGGNASNPGDLEAYYLAQGSSTWAAHDLSALADGPEVAPGASPAALYHDGYTSVYINSGSSHDLEEFNLTSIGSAWTSQDLSKTGGAPELAPLNTPSALYHSGYVGVYYADSGGNLWATYLPAIGDSWASQDLTAQDPGAGVQLVMNVLGEAKPVQSYVSAVYHSGYVSIFSIADSGTASAVTDTYLPAIGGAWQTFNLSTSSTPNMPRTSVVFPASSLVHYDANGGLTYTTLYTIDVPSGDLQATYLEKIGDSWVTQQLPS
jgi:hypothetical protein